MGRPLDGNLKLPAASGGESFDPKGEKSISIRASNPPPRGGEGTALCVFKMEELI